MEGKGVFLRILELFKTRQKAVLFLFALVASSTAFDITVPFITQKLIDRLMQFFRSGGIPPVKTLILAAVGILIATILSRILKTTYDYYLFKEATQREDVTKEIVLHKYYQLHTMFHHGSSSGQIIGRIERGATAIYTILYDIFGQKLLPSLIVFVGVLGSLLYKNLWIALAVFWPLPIYLLSVKNVTRKIYEIERIVNEEFEAVSKEAYDVAGNILTVKKFFQEKPELENQMQILHQARATQYSAERLWGIMENIQTLLATLGRISVILLAGFFVLDDKSTIGEFVLYISLNNMIYSPMAQLSQILPRLRRNMARVERLFGILDEPIQILDKPDAMSLPLHQKSIEFQNVWFNYSRGKRYALSNINITIPKGNKVALVGRSGSGKTTFVNLLLRSFDPEKGVILIDGYDIRDVTRESLLSQIAVVPQEIDLFSRSIFANIAYGKPEVTKEAVIQAAQTALAHDFIMKAEFGYDTVVGERGIKLSGGERQRIGIARAILRDPKILILDEATSHLDTESERLIAQATQALIKNRTTFIIAHRLSTILEADVILVFNKGELEAVGKNEELLNKSPTYEKLHRLQFAKD